MKRIQFLIITQLTFFVSACGNDPGTDSIKPESSISYRNDAEVKKNFWVNDQFVKSNLNAHSGNYVSVTDSAMPFSLVLRKPLGTISIKELRSVVVSAWVYADSLLKSFNGLLFVVSVNDDSKNIYFRDFSIENVLKESKKWYYVSKEIPMRFDQDSRNVFSGYILNNSKTKVLVDDISFRFIEK